jgi:hypothetical protein
MRERATRSNRRLAPTRLESRRAAAHSARRQQRLDGIGEGLVGDVMVAARFVGDKLVTVR